MIARSLPLILLLGFLSAHATAQCELERFAPDGLVPRDQFGHSTAVEGDLAVVGAWAASASVANSGAVYVYRTDGSTWSAETVLTGSFTGQRDHFGAAVAIEDQTIFVGSTNMPLGGSVEVFRKGVSGWERIAELAPSNLHPSSRFGTSIAVDGDTLLVGATFADGVDTRTGAAWVFEWDGTSWVETQKLIPSVGMSFDEFGSAISLDGDRALIAAYDANDLSHGLIDNGFVFVFERDATGWHETALLRASDEHTQSYFGTDVALSGDTALISAESAAYDLEGVGKVYVFERLGTAWVETGWIEAPNPAVGDRFGACLDLGHDLVAIGAPGEDDGWSGGGSVDDTGSVFLYRRIGHLWVPANELHASDAESGDWLGASLAMDGSVLFLGATNTFATGKAYAWGIAPPMCSLGADVFDVSLSTGGFANLSLDAGPAYAGSAFWLLGTTAGTEPGISFQGLVLPLNYDGPGGYLEATLAAPNSPPLSNSMGFLDGAGTARCVFQIPPASDPALAGLLLHHAYAALDLSGQPPALFASNAVHVRILP